MNGVEEVIAMTEVEEGWDALRLVGFTVMWGALALDLGREPNPDEFGERYGCSRATAWRFVARYGHRWQDELEQVHGATDGFVHIVERHHRAAARYRREQERADER